MEFAPSSTIYLCQVPFDNTYKNQVFFNSIRKQEEYFTNKVLKTFSEYLTVRTVKPDGGFQSSVKVQCNIDLLQTLGINYMYYRNENLGDKIFYAFVTKLIYINEGTTEIIFETDVYQTWLFKVELKPSYVVREHSETDEIGEHLVPESFNFQDYVFETAVEYDELDEWGYLIASTEKYGEDVSRGDLMTGIYQGLYFYYYESVLGLNNMLNAIESEGGDCVVFIAVIPRFNLKASLRANADGIETIDEGNVLNSSKPSTSQIQIKYNFNNHTFEGFTPKNKKLFTSPFIRLIVTNHNGEQADYNVEDFEASYGDDNYYINFKMCGDISANPSITLFPLDYKGIDENYDCGISISGFPQCAFNTDTFKLWLAKNQYGVALDTTSNAISGVASLLTGNVGGAVSGAMGILNTQNEIYKASKEPNKHHSGSAKNNLLTAINKNKFDFYWQKIKKEYAQTVDDFFTMYGYQTNRLKQPNVSSRPYFNYIQTIDVNIVGGIPQDDMMRLKQIYNNGVTLWKPTATIGDYSVDNSPQ